MNHDQGGAKPEREVTDTTPEQTGQIEIARSAEDVFAFVSDIRNLPAFLSGMRIATPQGPGRVAVEGAQYGRRFHAEGWMRVDREALAMEWGTSGGEERSCSGALRVVPLEAGGAGDVAAAPRSRLDLRLRLQGRSVSPVPGMRAQGRGQAGRTVGESIAQALAAIRSLCEGAEPGRAANPRGLARMAEAEEPQGDAEERREEGRAEDSRPYGRSGTMNPPDLT